jgi:predicted transcriptional regulator YdeE
MKALFTILSIATVLISDTLLGQDSPRNAGKINLTEENIVGNNTIVEKPALLVIGIDCRTSNAPEAGPHDIPKLWGRFYNEGIISQIPNKVSNEVIALYCDYAGDHTQPYSVVIGCYVSSLDTIPEGMVAKTIPASSYAVFRAIGEYPSSLIETWGNIWKQPDLQRTYTGDFELYGDKFGTGSPKEVEVYIAIPDEHRTK